MKLTEKGQCPICKVKPLVYKRPTMHYFCIRCDREYGADGKFQPNWAWSAPDTMFGTKLILHNRKMAAMQVVNELADMWNVPVDLRQNTNDKADHIVEVAIATIANQERQSNK